jgi:hypothetical protein
MRREETKAVRVVIKMKVEGKRRKGRLQKRWLDTIENDIRVVGVCVGGVENQDELKFRTRVAVTK